MSKGVKLTDEQRKAQKLRSRAIGISLAGFVLLVFLVTVLRRVEGGL